MQIFPKLAVGVLLAFSVIGLQAQDYRYHAYVDADGISSSGCSVVYPGGTVVGAETRLTAEVTNTTVTDITLAVCSGGIFGGATSLGAGHPVGLNTGLAGSDVIEFAATRDQLGAGRSSGVRLQLVGESAGGISDVLLTRDGSAAGSPIWLGLPTSIPLFGGLGITLMILALLWVGGQRARRLRMAGLGALLFAGSALAANFVLDGSIGDWAGEAAQATDPAGDASAPDDGADVRQLFASLENGVIFFRVDATDVENQRPVVNDQAQTYLEDAAAQVITLTGSDGDGDALTFAIASNPTRGVLGAITPINATSASVTYTPSANENGADSFTFTANDGQATSIPGTVSITLTPVNDVPSFASGGNVSVFKDTGPQTIAWATAISAGPANESGQTLSFNITANTNAALFSMQPSISPAGVLSFNGAPNGNGTAMISVTVMDNGGTANGGADTSAAQNFDITLNAVNDAPSFTAGANQTVLEDAGAQTVAGWATAISAGPPDEAGQLLTFNITNNTNAALFSAGPAVNAAGDLTYTTAANANGAATITLNLMDDGGTANGGVDTSPPQSFTISVTAVNDVPSFTSGGDVNVFKDTGPQTISPWATTISAGPADELGQILSFNITNNSNAALFSVLPSVSPSGVLTFTGAANANGTATITLNIMDNGGTANLGVDTSATQTFDITLNAVNDAPSFMVGANQTVFEDGGVQTVAGWATAISAGPPDEIGQVLTFNITGNTNAALFSAGPAVDATGQLTYTPAANANGAATITLVLMDDGGTANGGLDTSPPQNFTITVTAVNDVPSFTAQNAPAVNEDAGPQTATVATAVSAGPPDEVAQTLSFTITNNSNAALFNGTPTISPAGVLSYTPVANTSGTATLTFQLMDNGGTANSGADTSATQIATVTVNSVNDAPSFTVGANQTVAEDAGAQTVNAWASGLSVGPLDEAGQTLSFNITGNTNPGLFSAGPAVDATGALTYTPAANANGFATITLNIMDNGGTANGGVDTSAPQNFTITVNAVNDAPVNTVPSAQSTSVGVPLAFNTGNGNAISVTDIDAAAGAISTTISTTLGNVTATSVNGSVVVGSGTATLSITDTVADVNATLQTLSYVSATGGVGSITVQTNDQGNTGSGGALIAGPDAISVAVDKAPEVSATVPTNGAVGVLVGSNLSVTFDEPVTLGATWIQLVCPSSGTRNVGDFAIVDTDPTFTLNPNVDFNPGETCTATIFAAQVTDDDTIDGPDAMLANYVFSFATQDVAPIITGATPALAAVVNQNQTLTLNFSENVNIAAGGINLTCPGAVAFTPALPINNVNTVTLTPSSPLPAGASCSVQVVSTLVTDVDAVDPPNELDGDNSGDGVDGDVDDFSYGFAVDAAPAFVSSSPMTGAMSVAPNANISVTFTEAVNANNASFTIDCGAGNLAFAASGSASATITLDPTADLPGGQTCTVTAVPLQIDDTDLIDPPANPAGFDFSFTTASVANDDAYPVNRHLTLAAPGAAELDANDQLGSGTITGFGAAIGTANGTAPGATLDDGVNGTLTLNANGTFSFFPPVNPVGTTTDFFYTVTGGDTASITFTYQDELVWFVDDNAVGTTCTGDNTGAQACPATTLGAVAAIDTTNDTIFVFPGNQTATITLEVGTRLIGDGASGALALHSGVIPVLGSAFAAFGGTDPVISCGGNCITAPAAGNNFLRGFTVADSGTTGSDITGSGFGTLTVNEVTLGGNGRALNLVNGTLTGSFDDIDVTASTVGGLVLNNIAGTWAVNSQMNIATTGSSGIAISNTPAAGTMNFSGAIVGVTGAGTGTGVSILGGAGATHNMGGLFITTANGTGLSANTTTITIGPGSTVNATGGPAIDATTTSFGAGASFLSVSSTNSAGKGINLDTNTGSLTMSGGAITAPAGIAFDLNAGSAGVTYAGSITSTAAARLIEVTNRTGATTTFSGNLSGTGGTHTGINIANNTGGTVEFSGSTKTLNTGANTAVTLGNNTGSNINFSGGGLSITTTSGVGFNATGGAAGISVSGSFNTISSTTGTALNVNATTIAGTGLTFQSINANGGTNGIVLNTTGALGGLTVTGNSAGLCGGSVGAGPPATAATTSAPVIADCTGGTLQAHSGPSVLLTATNNISLTRMRVINSANDGVQGTNVTGFSLISSLFDNNGNAINENALDFGDSSSVTPDGLHGTGVITNSAILNSYYNGVSIRNNGGAALTSFNITGSQFRSLPANGDSNDSVFMEAGGTSTMAISVTGSHFSSIEGDHFQTAALNSGDLNVNFANNTLIGGHSTPLGQGITINAATGAPGWDGRIDYDVNGNHIIGAISNGVSVVLGTSSAAAVFDGFVRNNVIGTSGVALSCSTQANGVYIDARGNGTHTSAVTGNTIRQCFDRGILTEAGDGDSVLNLTVQSNLIDQQVAGSAREAFQTNFGITSTNVFGNIDTNVVCLQFGGAGALANTLSQGGDPSLDDFRLRKRFEATVRLPGYAGGTGQDAGSLGQVVTFIQGQNTGSAGEPGSAAASGTGGGYTGGAPCPLPL